MQVGEENHIDTDDDPAQPDITNPGTTIIISKLNPCVEEFVPRRASSSCKIDSKDKVLVEEHNNVVNTKDVTRKCYDQEFHPKNCKDEVPNEQYSKKDNFCIQDKNEYEKCSDDKEPDVKKINNVQSSTNSISENEFEDIAKALKSKISHATKSKTYALKREKNMAISSLLKLYTESPVTATKIKLMTPNDFELPKTKSKDLVKKNIDKTSDSTQVSDKKDGHANNETFNAVSEKTLEEPRPCCEPNEEVFNFPSKNINSCPSKETVYVPVKNENDVAKKEKQISDTKCAIDNTEESKQDPISSSVQNDPEVLASIKKVNNWLEPKKEKEIIKPSLHLGPIVYKRKGSNKSPTSVTHNKIQKPDQCYKPSSYADDLVKKYTEKLKLKESQNVKVTWDNLDEVLKRKDEEIKIKNAEMTTHSGADR